MVLHYPPFGGQRHYKLIFIFFPMDPDPPLKYIPNILLLRNTTDCLFSANCGQFVRISCTSSDAIKSEMQLVCLLKDKLFKNYICFKLLIVIKQLPGNTNEVQNCPLYVTLEGKVWKQESVCIFSGNILHDFFRALFLTILEILYISASVFFKKTANTSGK